MSEDLDFTVPVAADATRARRSLLVAGLREAIATLPRHISGLHVVQPVHGANNSTQYSALIGYDSRLTAGQETILLEVALREPLLTPAMHGAACTLLLDPLSGRQMIEPVKTRCLSRLEAFAEKWRAALSRRKPAIRDMYDLYHAVRRLGLDPQDPVLIRLVRQKLAVPGCKPIPMTQERRMALQQQLRPQLQSVLREQDFATFDLAAALDMMETMARHVC